MKKYLLLLLVLCFVCLSAAGCSGNGASQAESNSTNIQDDSEVNTRIDVDLTEMSSTMIYSEVNNIMTNPDDYMGKTIKI